MLMLLAYFVVGHILVVNRNSMPIRSTLLSFLAVMLCTAASRMILKLDLSIDKWESIFIEYVFASAPLATFASVCVWAYRHTRALDVALALPLESKLIERFLATLAAFLHALRLGLFIWESRLFDIPLAGSENDEKVHLPANLRSVQFLDVFNFAQKKRRTETKLKRKTIRKAKRLLQLHEELLASGGTLSEKDTQFLEAQLANLKSLVNDNADEPARTASEDSLESSLGSAHCSKTWFRCTDALPTIWVWSK
jgi:hypothetical protein